MLNGSLQSFTGRDNRALKPHVAAPWTETRSERTANWNGSGANGSTPKSTCPLRQSFDPRKRNRRNDLTLEQDESDQDRLEHNHRRCHHRSIRGHHRRRQISDPNRQDSASRRSPNNERPQEVVPRLDRRDDEKSPHQRPANRHDNAPEDPPFARPVDAPCFQQLVWDAQEELSRQEYTERGAEYIWSRQPQYTVNQPEVLHHDEQRNERYDVGHHQSGDECPEESVAAPEPQPCERVRGKHREDYLTDCHHDSDHNRDKEVQGEGGSIEQRPEVLERWIQGGIPHRCREQASGWLQRDEYRSHERKHGDNGSGCQDQVQACVFKDSHFGSLLTNVVGYVLVSEAKLDYREDQDDEEEDHCDSGSVARIELLKTQFVDSIVDHLGRHVRTTLCQRSEERRVGKECRYRWSPYP